MPCMKGTAISMKSQIPPRRRLCETMHFDYRLCEQHREFLLRLGELEHLTERRMMSALTKVAPGPVTIPVVVHVVFNAASENISDAQIQSQIATLNRDYRAKNTDKSKTPGVWSGLVTDAGIQFALASKDPSGKPTSGITRTNTTRTSF